MKLIFLTAIIVITNFSLQGNIYDIEVQPVEGGSPVSLSSFAGKKILFTTISSLNPDTTQLALLDSLQKSDSSLQVIAVPAADLGGGAGSDQVIKSLKADLSLGFMITQTAMVTKNSGTDQVAVFKWLTNVSENGHFDMDVNTKGQLFIVSRSGILYSVLESNVPANILSSVLNQEPAQ